MYYSLYLFSIVRWLLNTISRSQYVKVNNTGILLFIIILQSWGPELDQNLEKISEFLEELDTFVASLGDAQDNLTGHVTLAETEYDSMLHSMRSPSDYQTVGKDECFFNNNNNYNNLFYTA